MDSVTGPSSRPLQTANDTPTTPAEENPAAAPKSADVATISYNPDAISAATVMAILAHQNQQNIELNSDQQLVRNGEQLTGGEAVPASQRNADALNGLVNNEDGSDLFTRIETAHQGRLSAADGKMSRSDLEAALAHGGLSADERATAEYLLANFDQMKTGKFITKESLQAYATGLTAANDPSVPYEGLQSFVDGGDGKGLKNRGMDSDFKDLANGKRRHSVSMEDLQKGLNDPDFSAEQKAAIQYMIDNFDSLSHGDGTIAFKELDTFVSGLQQGMQSNSAARFESFPVAAAVLMDMGITEVSKDELQAIIATGTQNGQPDGTPLTPDQLMALQNTLLLFDSIADENGKVSTADLAALSTDPKDGLAFFATNEDAYRSIALSAGGNAAIKDIMGGFKISKDDLDAAINSGKFEGAQKTALIHLRTNFDAIAGEDGQISHGELQRAAASVHSSHAHGENLDASQAALESAVAYAGSFSDTANNASFLQRLDDASKADDKNYRNNFFDALRGKDHNADRSTFVEPVDHPFFKERTRDADGQVSRNDLQAALESSNFSDAEKAFVRVLLENFTEISDGSNTISNEQIQTFGAQFQMNQANSFDAISQEQPPSVPVPA